MEHQPAKAFEERLSQMSAALAAEQVPPTPSALYGPLSRRSRTPVWRYAAIGACGIAAAGLLLVPRESAASMLQHLAEAGIDYPVQTVAYEFREGKFVPHWETTVYRDKAHLRGLSGENEIYIDGTRQYSIDHLKNFVLLDHITPRKGEALFYSHSLKRMLNFDYIKSVRHTTAPWRGRQADRFEVHSEFLDALGQQLRVDQTIFADRKKDLPLYTESTTKGGTKGQFIDGLRSAIEWRYPDPRSLDLSPKLPPGAPIYEPAKMRLAVKEQVLGNLGEDIVEGIKVTLRAVYANEYGGLEVFTTGGTGRIERHPAGLRINGVETKGAFSAGQNEGHWTGGGYERGGAYVFEPLEYRGSKLVFQTAGWAEVDVPEKIDLEVPVWKADNSPAGRHLAGYARFKSIKPVRYGGQILSDGMNRSVLRPQGASSPTQQG